MGPMGSRAGRASDGEIQPQIPWRSRTWPERGRPYVPAQGPPPTGSGAVHAVPTGDRADSGAEQGRPGVYLKESLAAGPASARPPAPVTSFLPREPTPLRQREA